MTTHGNDLLIWILQTFIIFFVVAIREGGIDNVKNFTKRKQKYRSGIGSSIKVFFMVEMANGKGDKLRIALSVLYFLSFLVIFPILDINNINPFISMALIYAIGFIFIFISSKLNANRINV